MNQKDFIEKFHTILPECQPDAARIWCDFAVECVDQQQYVHFQAAESRDASIESWLEVLYEGLRQTRETFGAELATKVAALSLEPCCLYPGEMPRAAECLRTGDSAKDILAKIESGEIDCTDLFSAAPSMDVDSGNITMGMNSLREKLRDERESGPPVQQKHSSRKCPSKHKNHPDR